MQSLQDLKARADAGQALRFDKAQVGQSTRGITRLP
jgi:hypothetical protein